MSFPDNLPEGWRKRLGPEKDEPYFRALSEFLKKEYQTGQKIFPKREHILRALQEVDYDDVRVVILGQDPYHGDHQAIGLCFGVPDELRVKPPSLQNIIKEIRSDLGQEVNPQQSTLLGWVGQGVLLLNTVLTVRANRAFSHRDKGWETFTDRVIAALNEREEPVLFILWGAAAQKKKAIITGKQHRFLESPHPSPLSANRGFFGCKHFSKANQVLESLGKEPIDWTKTGANLKEGTQPVSALTTNDSPAASNQAGEQMKGAPV